jgi:hypothetical protein
MSSHGTLLLPADPEPAYTSYTARLDAIYSLEAAARRCSSAITAMEKEDFLRRLNRDEDPALPSSPLKKKTLVCDHTNIHSAYIEKGHDNSHMRKLR